MIWNMWIDLILGRFVKILKFNLKWIPWKITRKKKKEKNQKKIERKIKGIQ